MTKPGGKKGHRGLLIGMVKYPKSAPKTKSSIPKKIALGLAWVGLGGLLLFMLVGGVMMILNPRLGEETKEADVVVDRLEENPQDFPPEMKVDLAAVVELEKRWVRIPLDAARRETVAKGTQLHVRYDYAPRMRMVQVLEWRIAESGGVPTR